MQIPEKVAYKGSEVCQYTDTQPYVLHFWTSEFPQLSQNRTATGQPVYNREDIDLVKRIKQLLDDEEYTIADARRMLDEEREGGPVSSAARHVRREEPEEAEETPDEQPAISWEEPSKSKPTLDFGSVPRERYDDAVDEITHLRLKLKEAESDLRRKESALSRVEDRCTQLEERRIKSISRLESLLQRLDG